MEKSLQDAPSPSPSLHSKREELIGFLFLTVIVMPAIAIAIVGGYGFLVWMLQWLGLL